MKKAVIAIIVIIVLAFIGYMVWGKNGASVPNTTDTGTTDNTGGLTRDDFKTTGKEATDSSLLSRLKSVSVSASETGNRVALSNGKANFSSDGVKGSVVLGDIAVEKTVGGSKFIVATLSVSSGSAAAYNYVVLFEDKDGTITDKSYSLLGDRVKVTGLRADEVSGGLVVSVTYLDHDKGEALTSAPSVPRTKILVVEDGMFNAAKEINL